MKGSQNLAVGTSESPSPAQESGLLPCPFCENEQIVAFTTSDGKLVGCDNCENDMVRPTMSEAKTAWNTRASTRGADTDEVSKALAELRKMFPSCGVLIDVNMWANTRSETGGNVSGSHVFITISPNQEDVTDDDFSGTTLAECMAKVRQWRKEQQWRGKVHYRYYGAVRIACNPFKRWRSQNLTSTRSAEKVTCGNCRRVIEAEKRS